MQYIDNDMDDLFKKSGEQYPLRVNSADWDAVQARLADASNEGAIKVTKKFNRNYLWLLLLLVPIIMISFGGDRVKTADRSLFPAGESKRLTIDQTLPVSAPQVAAAAKKRPASSGIVTGSTAVQNDGQPSAMLVIKNEIPVMNDVNKNDAAVAKFYGKTASKTNTETIPGQQLIQDDRTATAPGFSQRNAGTPATNDAFDDDKAETTKEPVPVDSTTAIRQPNEKDSVSTGKQSIAVSNPEQAKKMDARQEGIYYGVTGGPDASSVKSQKINNIGYSIGLVLGYRINRHWAVEAGALWDKKKYYTSGKYFDKAGANIPPSVTLYFLDGGCNMFEFPISVRYHLPLKRNSAFATAGLTSFLMKEESYNYGADNAGMYYEAFKSYKNSGNHLFANVQLSAGYEYHISRKMSLRIEPYIKLPVKDIGIGKIPVSSKGIYFGVIRNIR